MSSQLFVLHQVQIDLVFADAGEVAVALDESWNRGLTQQIDHARGRSHEFRDVGVAADEDDGAVPRGQRLRRRRAVVERDDAAAAQHEIRGRHLRRRLSGDRDAKRQQRPRRAAAKDGSDDCILRVMTVSHLRWEQLRQIITEYPRLRVGRHVELVENLLLRVEHRLLPASRKERRVRSEQQPGRARRRRARARTRHGASGLDAAESSCSTTTCRA